MELLSVKKTKQHHTNNITVGRIGICDFRATTIILHNGIQQQWYTTTMEDNLHGRGPPWKLTSMEDDLNARQHQWKTA